MRQQPAKPVVFTSIANGVFLRRRSVGLAKRPHAGIHRQRPLFTRDSWTQFEKIVQGYSFADAQALMEQAHKSASPA